MRQLFLVYEQHGGPWDWSRALSSVNLIISLGLALAVLLGPLAGGAAYQLPGAAPVVVVVAAVLS